MKLLYKDTHGKDFKLPRPIMRLVRDGILEDVSYRNDAVPSFSTAADMTGRVLQIYVNENDRRKWEADSEDANQYYVARWNPETDTTPEDLLMTDDWHEVHMLVMRHALTSPEMLGAAFVKRLEMWLPKKTLKTIVGMNAMVGRNENVCATHDFCDANEAMYAAFQSFDPNFTNDPSSQDQCDMWNDAWKAGQKILHEKYADKKYI